MYVAILVQLYITRDPSPIG